MNAMEKKKTSKTGKTIFFALRIVLGAVFLYASYDKILHPEAFAQAVYNYQILPDAAVNLVSLVLPWLELLLGLCLIFGVWLPGGTMITTGLLTAFIASLVFNQVRGLDIHCGCFSASSTAGPADFWTILRDVVFWGISLYLAVYTFVFGSNG